MRYLIVLLVSISAYNGFSQLDSARMFQYEFDYFFSKDSSVAREILAEKFNYAAKENCFDRSQLELLYRLRQHQWAETNSEVYYWNLALLAHVNGEFRAAWYAMEQYRKVKPIFNAPREWLLYILISSQYTKESLEEALQGFKESAFYNGELLCIEEQMQFEFKRKQGLVLMSYFIPGSGLLLNGNLGEGAGALILNGGIAIGITALLLNAAYFNAGLWLLTWVPKFYLGNVELTKRRIASKQQAKKNERTMECALIWKNVLEEENFRLLLFN